MGADNWPVEVSPNPDKQLSLPVHQLALVVNGIHLLENLKLDELAAKKVYEFVFVDAAAEDPGRHRLHCLADCGAVALALPRISAIARGEETVGPSDRSFGTCP